MTKRLLCGLCLSAWLMIPHYDAAAAELVVIGSTGPEIFLKGDVIDSARAIRVPNNASVTLMDVDGKVVTVRGPYAGAIGGPKGGDDMGIVKLVSALFNEHSTNPLGAFRGAPGAKLDDPWAIDASTPGDKCVRASGAAMLWQPASGKLDELTLTHVAAGKTVKVPWPAGAPTLEWPSEIPLEQGANYDVKLGFQIGPNRIALHIAEAGLVAQPRVVAWMVRAGCYAQAQVLLGALPADQIIDPSGGKGG